MFNNKKNKEFDKRIETIQEQIKVLYDANQSILNFDELYKKLQDSFERSKALINEQLLQYDKKIVELSNVVSEKLASNESTLNEQLIKLSKDIESKFLSEKAELEETKQKIEENVNSFLNEIKITIDNNLSNNEAAFKEVVSKQIEELSSRFEDLVKAHEKNWEENNIKYNDNINAKLAGYELNLNNMIDEAVNKSLNQLTISEVTNKAYEQILYSFNQSLLEIKESERKTIVDAINALVSPKLPITKKEETKNEVKKLGKNELFHQCYEKLKLCVNSGVIPMIVGPAGTGKSTAAEQLSRDMGLNFYLANRIQNTFELVGFVNAAGEYVTTQFYEAYTKGGIFLFDEVDASSPEALVTINAAIAQGYMAFPGHPNSMPMHKDFKAICAGNTFGTGSTLQYTGRNKLDAATLDRFMIVEWGYDTVLEDKLISDKDLLNICWAIRQASEPIDQNIIISTRGMVTLEKMINANNDNKVFELTDLFRQKFFENISKEKIKKVYYGIENICKNNKYLEVISNLYK